MTRLRIATNYSKEIRNKVADRVRSGCGLLLLYTHILFVLPRSGLAGCEDEVELLGGGCVGGLDGVSVDSGGRGWISMAEAGGDGGDRDAGVDHQGCVRMAEAVDGDVRQVVRSNEVAEPAPYRIRMDWHTVRLGEQAVAIYPPVAHTQTALSLPPFVLLEQLDGNRWRFDVAGGAIVLGRIRDDALVRNVQRGAGDADDGGLEVDVLPLQTTQFLPTHPGEHEHFDHRAVLHILTVKQGEQPGGLFLVEVSRRGLFFFREGGSLARI